MPSGFTAPYHSYEDLRHQADAFPVKHHPTGNDPDADRADRRIVERRLQKDGTQDTFKQ